MKLVITGGGSGGHTLPLVAVLSVLKHHTANQNHGLEVYWLGSKKGPELKLSQEQNIPFHHVPAGKLRRYFDWRNFTDIFKTFAGTIKAWWILGKLKPNVVFSKGGFVSFPTVFAAWLRNIPVVAHESDVVPGLTTKLCFPFVKKQCLGFAASKSYFSQNHNKLVYTGVPLRDAILRGNSESGLQFLGLTTKTKPVLLVMGGSLGAAAINQVILTILPQLLKEFTVVHSTGAQKNVITTHRNGYFSYETLADSLADLYQLADLIVSRAGASTVCEILTLKKPAIFIPLTRKQSRGDQIVNCELIKNLPSLSILDQDTLTPELLLDTIKSMCQSTKNSYDTQGWSTFSCKDSSESIAQILLTYLQPHPLTTAKINGKRT